MAIGNPQKDEIFGLSDEDFLKMNSPPEDAGVAAPASEVEPGAGEPAATDAATEVVVETPAGEGVVEPEPNGSDPAPVADEPAPDLDKPAEGEPKPEDKPGEKAPEKEAQADPLGSPKADAPKETPKTESFVAPTNEEAQAVFMKVMTPFKANGKLIQLKTPEEAVQLMQMGANYARKMQDIQPHRKVLTMLENNGLLDEGKLSFLIDLEKKNPEAIKKLIKDAGVDPLEIDTSVEPQYIEGAHQVTDKEVQFATAVKEIVSEPTGKDFIFQIDKEWDQTSKDAIWENPQIMRLLYEQRETGIFDDITSEIERRRMLGQIPDNTPFLDAYKLVGDEMAQEAINRTKDGQGANGGGNGTVTTPGGSTQPIAQQPVATTVSAPKAAITNGDKASAAAPSRSVPKKAEVLVNPLAMSDDDFLKQMQNRL